MLTALYWVVAFEAAMVPMLTVTTHGHNVVRYVDEPLSAVTFEGEIGIEVGDFDLFAWGSTRSTQLFDDADRYIPILQRYDIGAGAAWRNIEIGVRHYCEHPVATFEDIYAPFDISRREIYVNVEIDSRN